MFNQSEDADVCGICSKIYVDPRLLPCGESACHECIQNVIQNDLMKREFECKFCDSKHVAPPGNQGFYVNRGISKLLKANADKMNEFTSVRELKEKLAEIKINCEEFKLNLDNGVDQLREHCIRIRNQVHLRTEKLIEEMHNLNESLIAEINKYEQECMKAFDEQMKEKSKDLESFVGELSEFYTEKSNYLNKFKVEEKVVEIAVTKADVYLTRLTLENHGFKRLVFNGNIIELSSRVNELSSAFLGSFVYKEVGVGSTRSFRDYNFKNTVFKSYKSHLNLFTSDFGINFGFHINTSDHLALVCFSNDDKIITQVPNALESNTATSSMISSFLVTESRDTFIFYVKFLYTTGSRAVRGHALDAVDSSPCLVFMLDKNFAYSKHTFNVTFKDAFLIAANNSSVLMVSRNNEYQNLNMNLDPIIKRSWKTVKTQVGQRIIDAEMNDQYVFFLCNTNKLKIIEINSGWLVHEIETSADQMKLASTDYLLLFSQLDRITYVYEQGGEFRKLDEIPFGLSPKLSAYVFVSRDKCNAVALYNLSIIRYMSLD
jgi:hypothetical protein